VQGNNEIQAMLTLKLSGLFKSEVDEVDGLKQTCSVPTKPKLRSFSSSVFDWFDSNNLLLIGCLSGSNDDLNVIDWNFACENNDFNE